MASPKALVVGRTLCSGSEPGKLITHAGDLFWWSCCVGVTPTVWVLSDCLIRDVRGWLAKVRLGAAVDDMDAIGQVIFEETLLAAFCQTVLVVVLILLW